MENLLTNELWEGLKAAINKGIDRHIPHKVCKSKDNLLWITPRIRKLIKKRDRLSIKRKGLVRSSKVFDLGRLPNESNGLSKIYKGKCGKLIGAMWSPS